MSDPIPTLDDDPCGRATALKAKRDEIITGAGVVEFDNEQGNGLRRRLRFSAADLPRLDREIAVAESKCRLASGQAPRRHAVVPRRGGW